MNGYYGIFVLRAVIAILLVGLGGGEVSVAWAEQTPSTRQGNGSTDQVAKSPARSSDPAGKTAGNIPKNIERKNLAAERVERPLRGKASRRAHRHSRERKVLRPQVMITPKPDLSYHGMLEQPQRYTPQYQQGKGSAPNPNAGTLLHDHFQELDKNRDGAIDPFERALGRLDIDRDLADRQWQ